MLKVTCFYVILLLKVLVCTKFKVERDSYKVESESFLHL